MVNFLRFIVCLISYFSPKVVNMLLTINKDILSS